MVARLVKSANLDAMQQAAGLLVIIGNNSLGKLLSSTPFCCAALITYLIGIKFSSGR